MRFLFALPVALVATAGLYFFWFSGFINQKCDGCGVEPTRVAEVSRSWKALVEEIITECNCISMILPIADPTNSYTRHDKASPTAPEPVECGEDCEMPAVEIADEALRLRAGGAPTAYRLQRISPAFPRDCGEDWVSGQVTVEFDVSPEGIVTNARVIESTDQCMNSAALRNIARMRYEPQTDKTGRAIWRRGVRQIFTFELTD